MLLSLLYLLYIVLKKLFDLNDLKDYYTKIYNYQELLQEIEQAEDLFFFLLR